MNFKYLHFPYYWGWICWNHYDLHYFSKSSEHAL